MYNCASPKPDSQVRKPHLEPRIVAAPQRSQVAVPSLIKSLQGIDAVGAAVGAAHQQLLVLVGKLGLHLQSGRQTTKHSHGRIQKLGCSRWLDLLQRSLVRRMLKGKWCRSGQQQQPLPCGRRSSSSRKGLPLGRACCTRHGHTACQPAGTPTPHLCHKVRVWLLGEAERPLLLVIHLGHVHHWDVDAVLHL